MITIIVFCSVLRFCFSSETFYSLGVEICCLLQLSLFLQLFLGSFELKLKQRLLSLLSEDLTVFFSLCFFLIGSKFFIIWFLFIRCIFGLLHNFFFKIKSCWCCTLFYNNLFYFSELLVIKWRLKLQFRFFWFLFFVTKLAYPMIVLEQILGYRGPSL